MDRSGGAGTLFGRILGSGARVLEDVPPCRLPLAWHRSLSAPTAQAQQKDLSPALLSLRNCGKKEKSTNASCTYSTSNKNLLLLLSARGGGRAPPSNRPAARGHAPPPYVTVLPQAAAAQPLRAGTQHRSCMRSFVWSKRPRRHPRSRCVSRARGGPRPSISRPAGGFDPKRAGHGWCVPRRRHPAGWRPARAGADLVATGLCVQIGRGARRLLF